MKAVMLLMTLAVLSLGILAFTRSVAIFLAVGLLIGFSNAGIRVLRVAYLFDHIPNNIIGRTNSVFSMANTLMRVGFILLFSSAFFSRGSNITWAYGIMAGFVALALFALLLQHYKPSSESSGKEPGISEEDRMRPLPKLSRKPSSRASG